jgi:hypothetical protein
MACHLAEKKEYQVMLNGIAVTPDELETTTILLLAFLLLRNAIRLQGELADANIVICCDVQHMVVI